MFYPDPDRFTRTVKILLVCIAMLVIFIVTRLSIFLLVAVILLLHVFSFNPWKYFKQKSNNKSSKNWEE